MNVTNSDHGWSERFWRIHPFVLLVLALSAITILAFWFRLLNWPQVFVGPDVRFLESDCFYHMRRVFLAIQNRLMIPEYDPYMNYPQGFHCNWPPLFDQVIAGTALVFGLGSPSPHLVETIGAFVPPALGVLACPIIFLLARYFMSTAWALFAALVFSFLPFHVQLSVLGRPDHHVAVVLFASLLFVCALRLPSLLSRPARFGLYSVMTGFLLALMLQIWVGSLLFIGILAGWIAILLVLNFREQQKADRVFLGGIVIFLSAALFLWPVASQTHWARVGEMRWDALSGFHLLLLTASAAGLLLFRLTLKLVALRMHRSLAPSPGLSSPPDPDMQQAPSGILISYLILSGLMALLATYLVCFHLVHILTAGSKWILKEDRLLHHVAETAPLSLQTAAENFTGIIFLFPLLIVHMLHRGRKEGRLGSVLLFVVYSLTIGACTLVSERFSDLFSVVAAVLIGYFMSVLFQSATSLFSGHQKSPVFRKSRPSRLLATALCMAIAGCAAWPTARWLASYAKSAPLYSAGDLHEMCLWLRDHTAQSPGYADFSAKPDYSVLATWENGNALTYLARRANVANNFLGWPENREANLKPYRFFVADNLADAESILDECRVRYVVVSEPVISGQFARMLDVLGLDQNEYFVVNAQGLFESQRKMMNTMALRLYLHDGKHMNHFRLVFESTTKRAAAGQLSGIFKIFEYDKWAIRAQGPVPVSSGYSRSILKSPAPANDFRWE